MKKIFYVLYNVGKVKYLVSMHDGFSTHKDGSPFYGIKCFHNVKKLKLFLDTLLADGYIER